MGDDWNPFLSKSLTRLVEVASGIDMTRNDFLFMCYHLADDLPFDFVVNNCQRWCSEVLAHLVETGYITQAQVAALTAKGFTPFVGTIEQPRRQQSGQ